VAVDFSAGSRVISWGKSRGLRPFLIELRRNLPPPEFMIRRETPGLEVVRTECPSMREDRCGKTEA